MHHDMVGAHARWAVLWHKDKWHCKEFENDFHAALELYVKVKAAGRKGATLLCRNVGFPPPEHLRQRIKGYTKTKRVENGRKTIVRVPIYEHKLVDLNREGIYWCPYCRQLRRFVRRRGFMVDGVYVPESNMQCPVCGITDVNHHVRKHNPALSRTWGKEDTNGQGRSSSSSGRIVSKSSGGSKLTEEQRAAKRERARKRRERARGGRA